jgi:hypothetical protein
MRVVWTTVEKTALFQRAHQNSKLKQRLNLKNG